jgi:hypothetical protein
MFGERSVLREQNTGAGGGGGNAGNQGAEGTGGRPTTDPLEAGFAQTEPEDAAVDEYGTVGGQGEKSPAKGGYSGVVQRPVLFPEEKKTKQSSLYSVQGELRPGLAPDEQVLEANATANIQKAKRATAAAELQAMGLSTQYMAQYANVGELDAIEGERLHDEHFSVAKTKMDNLTREVQDAQSLKVNPFNWHESIGRGGRVAAAFSLLTGQMAAGAGNPNSALKMMDAAIERDISAQEQNIKNEYTNLKLQRGLGQDSRALHEEEMASLGKLRALKYSNLLGRLGAIKQHALNEGAYQAASVMESHYVLKQLTALQAERARILSVYVKGPIRASMLRKIQEQVTQLGQQLRPGTNITPPGGQAAQAPAVADALPPDAEPRRPGDPQVPVEKSLPAAPGRAGPVAGRRGPQAPTATTPTSEAPVQEAQGQPGPVQGTPEAPSAIEYEKPYNEYDDEPDHPEVTRESAEAYVESQVLGDRRKAKLLASHGGYARTEGAAQNSPGGHLLDQRDAQMIYAKGGDLPKGGFADDRDAQVFASWIETRPPLRKNYKSQEAFQLARDHHKFQANHYEIFEAPGRQSTIENGSRSFRVKRTSPMRDSTGPGLGEYNKAVAKLVEGGEYIDKLAQVARDYRRVGPGSGFFNSEEGAFSMPGFTSSDEGKKSLNQYVTRLAMGFIKSEDPTARLSDKDLEVGQAAMGLAANGTIRMLDIMQSLKASVTGRKYSENQVRVSMNRYLQVVALRAQMSYYKKFSNDLIPDYNTARLLERELDATQKWLSEDTKRNPQGD